MENYKYATVMLKDGISSFIVSNNIPPKTKGHIEDVSFEIKDGVLTLEGIKNHSFYFLETICIKNVNNIGRFLEEDLKEATSEINFLWLSIKYIPRGSVVGLKKKTKYKIKTSSFQIIYQ